MAMWRFGAFAAALLFAPFVQGAAIQVPQPTQIAPVLHLHEDLFWAAAQMIGLLLPAVVVFSGLGARIRNWCARMGRGRWYWTVTLVGCVYVTVATLASLPTDYWETVDWLAIAHRQAPPEFAPWLTKSLVPLLPKLAIIALFLWIPYALIARSPRRWWLYAAAALVPVTFAVLVALPVWVDPLTTDYKPLADAKLAAEIDQLAARCGVYHLPVFVGGDDTTVVGLGPTNRMILSSETMKEDDRHQLIATVGHELKHYVEGDNWKALGVAFVLMLGGFWFVDRAGRWMLARWSRRFGFSSLSDPASLPLIVLLLSVFWIAALPAFNLFDRHIEFEADRFGLELTHENEGQASLEAKYMITSNRLPDSDLFDLLFRSSHPSHRERIEFANGYHPWAEGKPLVYGDVCKPAP